MDLKYEEEQSRYAAWLHWSTLAGFLTLILTFAAYVFNILPARIPLEQLPDLWNKPASQYLKLTGMPKGWGWIGMLENGDLASLLGIAILSGCSIFCIFAVMPIYARRRDLVYLLICAFEIAVLVLAASGILSGRH